ncbi:aspartic peptidase domain-containing protein [Scheffersomyces xylosifermentans]|uniref:aspartic peptidase domain-containing protein n=1 Tax=Scheffersomyces xylosifermentans TaxID=1304137 RepID=UPI00315C6BC6
MVSILSFTRQAFLALALALLVNGLVVPETSSEDLVARDNKFVKVDFQVARGPNRESLNLTSSNKPHFLIHKNGKRAVGQAEVTLINEKTFYATNLLIGSNKQAVTTLLDTGSSDLWVVAKGATCQDVPDGETSSYCYEYGVYDKTTSTTFKNLGTSFSIQYADGTQSTGTWAKDDVSFAGGVGVTQLQLGDVTTTSSGFGVLGIGYTSNESTGTTYDNLPVVLKKQGKIATTAYSLYLAQPSDPSGTIIFGGIDNAKYSGTLVPLPVQSPYELSINLKSITVGGKTTTANINPVLDSGTTLSYLPQSLVKAVATALKGTADSSVGYIIDCNQPTNQYITYTFNGVTIKVPYSELPIELYYTNGDKYPGCALGILSTTSTPILGDNFLRSAYVAYNLDAKVISIAQVKYTTTENIVPF